MIELLNEQSKRWDGIGVLMTSRKILRLRPGRGIAESYTEMMGRLVSARVIWCILWIGLDNLCRMVGQPGPCHP